MLTPHDGARIARAVAQSTGNKLVGAAHALFAGLTTSQKGVEDLGKSVSDRVSYEAQAVASGVALSQTAAAVLDRGPHPAAKLAAAGIRLTGLAAAGAKTSEVMREVGDLPGPVREELGAIAREKSQGTGE